MHPNHEHKYIFAAAILQSQSPIMDSLHNKAHTSITLAVDFQDIIYVIGVTKSLCDICDYCTCSENKSKHGT